MFAPYILKSASRELKRIDPPMAQRIVDRIRFVYEALRKERLIVVHHIGHRSEIYERRKS